MRLALMSWCIHKFYKMLAVKNLFLSQSFTESSGCGKTCTAWHSASCRHIRILSCTYRSRPSNNRIKISDKQVLKYSGFLFISQWIHLLTSNWYLQFWCLSFHIFTFLKFFQFIYGVNFVSFYRFVALPLTKTLTMPRKSGWQSTFSCQKCPQIQTHSDHYWFESMLVFTWNIYPEFNLNYQKSYTRLVVISINITNMTQLLMPIVSLVSSWA